ncbi:MAG: hypothetical protein EHM36_07490 [Deltaproteobacteria bacterium]|nr:MAG: hypothetical protein EHM36_07490 [Deltaproteobacteria bacterium]
MKVKASELSKLRMTAGNEDTYSKVTQDGRLLQWVGIGWIDHGAATEEDYSNYPEVEREING